MRTGNRLKKALLVVTAVLLVSCGGDRSTPSPLKANSTQETPSAAPASKAIPGSTHGGRYWGVYTFVGGANDAGYDRSIRRLEAMGLERGYNFSDGELGCDRGAAEALRVPAHERNSAMGVAVYFHERQDARAFANSLEEAPVGVIRVRTLCAD